MYVSVKNHQHATPQQMATALAGYEGYCFARSVIEIQCDVTAESCFWNRLSLQPVYYIITAHVLLQTDRHR